MKNNRVMIPAVCVLCLAVGILIGVMGMKSRKETASGETMMPFESTEEQPSAAVLETGTVARTEPDTEKATVDGTAGTTQIQKDNNGRGENESSSQSNPNPEPEPEPTPEPKPTPDPEPDNSGDGEDMEWSPDIM